VESLYVDLLQFLYAISLAILVGGGFVLGSVVAPALFRGAPREEAGTLFGAVLARWDGVAILCAVLVVITSALKAGAYEVSGTPELRLVARWVALLVMVAAVVYSSGWATPVARSIRSQTRDFDSLPANAPARVEFAKLHRSSSGAMRLAVIAGLVAMLLS
jgi:hypothetical protein